MIVVDVEKAIEITRLRLESAVQEYMDAKAASYGYGDERLPPLLSAISYAEEPAVPKFQAEGQKFRAWRSLVWAACYSILGDVVAGQRQVPTVEELIAELPVLEGE